MSSNFSKKLLLFTIHERLVNPCFLNHCRTVKIGSSTKSFLHKLKSRTQTLDKTASEEHLHYQSNLSEKSGTGTINSQTVSDTGNQGNGKSTWSEHVWSTFIHRGYSDDVTEKPNIIVGKELLTDFQQDKFKYFFYHVLDLNTDHVISKEDFDRLNKRIKHYMDWSVNSVQFLALKEVHDLFLDSFLSASADIK